MMRGIFSSFFALCLAFAAFAAPGQKSVRVDFTSQPEGADVVVDGKSVGNTSGMVTLYDLQPGIHKVRFDMKNYEPVDEYLILDDEAFSVRHKTCHAVMRPMKGLLLVTTEPSGCDVSLDGLSFGETPRLIASLDANDVYRLLLQKPGYQSRTVEVKFNGRTPVVKHEKLILDSGTLAVSSEPGGADVTVNGIARGQSPVNVSDIPKGRATVVISKKGYKTETRELSFNAGDSQTLFVQLEGEPGSLYLTSVPDGARFYVNGETHGKAPVKIDGMKPGKYTVKAELDGFGTVERTVTINLGQATSEEFRLENVRGRLEVRTIPAGAQVLVDGRVAGTTKSDGSSAEASEVLMIENIDSGEHTVVIRKDGYAEIVRHPVVENSRTAQLSVRMKRVFKPNVEIVTANGTHRGIFVDQTPEAITVEVSMGITRSFPREEVKDVQFLYGTEKQP